MDARTLREDGLIQGARRSTLEEVTGRTLWADKLLNF